MQSFEYIPHLALDELAPSGRMLVIAPHPDDETLGCGGLITCAKAAGRDIRVVLLTDGAASHTGSARYSPSQMAALRAEEVQRAASVLGLAAGELATLSLPDGRLADEGADVLAERIQAITDVPVGAIFAPGADDPHPDHRAAAGAAGLLAARWGSLLWAYPVRSHVIEAFLQAPANLVQLDISAAIERKRAALACHASQLGDMIRDDPEGFSLTEADVRLHTCGSELYRRAWVGAAAI